MMTTETQTFARLIASLRATRQLSLGQLAKSAQISRTYLHHLEHGIRQKPSQRIARALFRTLDLHGEERDRFLSAYADLTGETLNDVPEPAGTSDLADLSRMLITHMQFPAIACDQFWNLLTWNRSAQELFDIHRLRDEQRHHLIHLFFDPCARPKFHAWDALAREFMLSFTYWTKTFSHLDSYHEVIRSLKRVPDFARLSKIIEGDIASRSPLCFRIKMVQGDLMTLSAVRSSFARHPGISMFVFCPADQRTSQILQLRSLSHQA